MSESYSSFLEAVDEKLRDLTQSQLQDLLRSWADDLPTEMRHEFINRLQAVKTQQKISSAAAEQWLDQVRSFTARIEDGDYCQGWGWDERYHDECDIGDESWAEEMDSFLREARKLLKSGQASPACQGYKILFEALRHSEEPGHLPGDPDSTAMLSESLSEHIGLYLRALYLSSAPSCRPAVLYEAMTWCAYPFGNCQLNTLIRAYPDPLPDLASFISGMIGHLLGLESSKWVNQLLSEAVSLQGIDTLAEFTRQNGAHYPSLYLEWVDRLRKAGRVDDAIQAIREGMALIQPQTPDWIGLCNHLIQLGADSQNNLLLLEGCRLIFRAEPSLPRLIAYFEADWSSSKPSAERQDAITYLLADRSDEQAERRSYRSDLLQHALMLDGQYERAWQIDPDNQSDGEIRSRSLSLLLFFLYALSGRQADKPLITLWQELISDRYHTAAALSSDQLFVRYRNLVDRILTDKPLTGEQCKIYTARCRQDAILHIASIVEAKERYLYARAAMILSAAATALTCQAGYQAGHDLAIDVRKRFARFSSFTAEITSIMGPPSRQEKKRS